MNATPHLHDEDIARLLDGAGATPTDLSVAALREHVRTCASCAAALEREALLDEEVDALAEALRFCPGCARASAVADDTNAQGRCAFCGVAFAPGGMRVERVLSESDHGRLYLAHGPDGPVALKEMVFARVPNLEALDRFEREARLLDQLRHERIPRFVASFREGEGVHLRLYLAQRFVDGPALADELKTRRFREDDARAIAREVLAILVDLQALSPPVLHRDIKPANLVRDRDGKLSLVDFGSARDVQKTTGGTLVGTFGYMPLEQLTGIVDESTDVYALGATLVHILTRRAPWESSSSPTPGALPPLPAVSRAFRLFLSRCLAPRDRRFPNARAALTALDTPAPSRTWMFAAAAAVVLGGASAGPAALRALGAPSDDEVRRALPAVIADAGPSEAEAPAAAPEQPYDRLSLEPFIGDVIACSRTSRYTGIIEATWTVAGDGRVHDASVEGNDADLLKCLARAIATWRFPAHEDGDVKVAVPFDFGGATEVRRSVAHAEKITIDLMDADVRNVIRLIGDVSRKGIIFGDELHGKVTMKFKNVPWDQVLHEVLRAHGLVAHERDGLIIVTSMAAPRPTRARQ